MRPPGFLGATLSPPLREAGFEYTTRLRSFKDLVTGRLTRRKASLERAQRMAESRKPLLERAAGAQAFVHSLLRIGLHPVDWQHGAVRRQALHLMRSALVAREAITYEDGSRVCAPRNEPFEVESRSSYSLTPQHARCGLGPSPSRISGQLFGSAPAV